MDDIEHPGRAWIDITREGFMRAAAVGPSRLSGTGTENAAEYVRVDLYQGAVEERDIALALLREACAPDLEANAWRKHRDRLFDRVRVGGGSG